MIFDLRNTTTLIIINPDTKIKVEVDVSKGRSVPYDYYEAITSELNRTLKMIFPECNAYTISSFEKNEIELRSITKCNYETIKYDDIKDIKKLSKYTLRITTTSLVYYISLVDEDIESIWDEWLDALNPVHYEENEHILRLLIDIGIEKAMEYMIDSVDYIGECEENEDVFEDEFISYVAANIDYFKKSTHPEAAHILGYYYDLIGDASNAQKYFSLSKDDIPYSKYSLGCIFEEQEKYDEAISLWKETLEMNPMVAEANYDLGWIYYHGKYGVARDFTKAFTHFKRAADSNYSRAYYYLGMCYAHAEGVPSIDDERALYYYNKAVAFSPFKSQRYGSLYSIGYFYDNGIGGLSKNENMAIDIYKTCLEENNCPDSAINLGHIYRDQSDYTKSLHYYNIAKEYKWYHDEAVKEIEKVSRLSRSTKYRIQDDGIVLCSLHDKIFKWYMPSEIYSVEVYENKIYENEEEYSIVMNEDELFIFSSKEKAWEFYNDLQAYFRIPSYVESEKGLLDTDSESFYYNISESNFIIVDWSSPNDANVDENCFIVSSTHGLSWNYVLPSEDIATDVFEYFCSLAF